MWVVSETPLAFLGGGRRRPAQLRGKDTENKYHFEQVAHLNKRRKQIKSHVSHEQKHVN